MNRQQFTKYIEDNQRAVRRFLTALCCGDTELADDLAQDTFVKAYLNCDTFREDSKFLSWIYRIAYNTFISNRRSYRIDYGLSVAESMESSERSDVAFEYQPLYAALDRLSDKERMSILLHYMQGYSVAEITDITQSSADAVRQQLSRGRQHLKVLLKD